MKKINFGIIGAGVIAEEYLKILSKNKKINISGIVGRTKKNSKRLSLKYNTNLFSTIDDLIRENLDIIIVAVNILSTVFVAKKLSKFKGKILFEKPLGVNLKQTLKISNHLSKNKKNCFVALNRRFYENIRFAKELLVNDKSKKIIQVIDQENLYLAKKLGHPKLVLNNWMYANSIHLVDLVLFFGNSKVKKITSEVFNSNQDKVFYSKIIFRNNNIAFYYSLWNRPGPWSINISSSKYFLSFKPIEMLEYRNLDDNKKLAFKKAKKDFKPGFEGMINAITRFHLHSRSDSKKSASVSKNNEINSLVNLEDYINLSNIIKKIYFKK